MDLNSGDRRVPATPGSMDVSARPKARPWPEGLGVARGGRTGAARGSGPRRTRISDRAKPSCFRRELVGSLHTDNRSVHNRLARYVL
jgi:hypothetical protein